MDLTTSEDGSGEVGVELFSSVNSFTATFSFSFKLLNALLTRKIILNYYNNI